MSGEDCNRAAARRITFELFAAGNLALMDALTTPDFVSHGQRREVHVMRFSAGRMAEQWGVVDRLSALQQLGLAPAPPR